MTLTSWATHTLQWPLQKEATPHGGADLQRWPQFRLHSATRVHEVDRKSTRLNSSHLVISYADFCLNKKQQSQKYSLLLLRPLHDAIALPLRHRTYGDRLLGTDPAALLAPSAGRRLRAGRLSTRCAC